MRVALALYELFVGAALLLLPWSRLWQTNWFFWRSGGLQGWILSGEVRGAVSGIGAALLISAVMTFMEIGAQESGATGRVRGQVTGGPRDARPIGG
jgi:hypothetical protein